MYIFQQSIRHDLNACLSGPNAAFFEKDAVPLSKGNRAKSARPRMYFSMKKQIIIGLEKSKAQNIRRSFKNKLQKKLHTPIIILSIKNFY